MSKVMGQAQIDILANVEQAEKKVQGFIRKVGQQEPELEIQIELGELVKSIDQVKDTVKDLGKSFQTIDKKNIFGETIKSLDSLKDSLKEITTITKQDAQGNALEKAFKVDFAEDFKAELKEVMNSFKDFTSMISSDNISAFSKSLEDMGKNLKLISDNLSTLNASKGLNALQSPEELGATQEALKQQQKALIGDRDALQNIKLETTRLKKAFSVVFDGGETDNYASNLKVILQMVKKIQDAGVDLNNAFVGDHSFAEAIQKIQNGLTGTDKELSQFTKDVSKRLKNIFSELSDEVTVDPVPTKLETKLDTLDAQIKEVSSDYTAAQKLFSTPIQIKIDSESLNKLSSKIAEVKNKTDGEFIKIEGFNVGTIQRIIDQLTQIVDAIRNVNTTLSQGINFNPVFKSIEEGNTALKEFKKTLKDLGMSQSSIPGFDNLVKSVRSGLLSVEDAVEESKKRINTALSIQEQSGAIQQSYIDLVTRLQTILKTQFPKIDLGNYEDIFEQVRNQSLNAVTALEQITNAEKGKSINIPVADISEENIKSLQDMANSLKKSLNEISKSLINFSADMEKNLSLTAIDQHLELTLGNIRSTANSMLEEFDKVGDKISGEKGITSHVNELRMALSELPDSISGDFTKLRNSIETIDSLINKLFVTADKKVFKIEGLNQNTIEKLKKAVETLDKTLSKELKISINSKPFDEATQEANEFDSALDGVSKAQEKTQSETQETEKTIQKINPVVTEFINKLQELRTSLSASDDINFFNNVKTQVQEGSLSIKTALEKIKEYFSNIDSNAGLNGLNFDEKKKQLIDYVKTLSKLDNLPTITEIDFSDDSELKKQRNYIKNLQLETEKLEGILKGVKLQFDDGSFKEITDLKELKNLNLNKVIKIDFVTDNDFILKNISELENITKKVKKEVQEPVESNIVDTSTDQKEVQKLEETVKEAEKAVQKKSNSNLLGDTSDEQKDIYNLTKLLDKLQEQLKNKPVQIEIDVNSKKVNSTLQSKIPESYPLDIILNIKQEKLNSVKADLENLQNLASNIKLEQLTLPDNFTNTLKELKTKLSSIDDGSTRSLVEEIEAVSAALAMLSDVNLKNLDIKNTFKLDKGQNLANLANSLEKISKAINDMTGEDKVLPSNLFDSIAKVDNVNGENFTQLANGMKVLKDAFKDIPDNIPDLTNLSNFLKDLGKVKFNADAIAAFNQLNVKQIKELSKVTGDLNKLNKLGGNLNSLKEGLVGLNQLKKIPDLKNLKISKTNVDNINDLTTALEELRKVLELFSKDAQNVIKQLAKIGESFSGIKNIDKLINMSDQQLKGIKGADVGIDVKDSISAIKKYYSEIGKLKKEALSTDDTDKIQNINSQIDEHEKIVQKLREELEANNLLTESDKAYLSIQDSKIAALNKEIKVREEAKQAKRAATDSSFDDDLSEEEKNKAVAESYNNLEKAIKDFFNAKKKYDKNEDSYFNLEDLNKADETLRKTKEIFDNLTSKGWVSDDMIANIDKLVEGLGIEYNKNVGKEQASSLMSSLKGQLSEYKSAMNKLAKDDNAPSVNESLITSYKRIQELIKGINQLKQNGIVLSEKDEKTLQEAELVYRKYRESIDKKLSGYDTQFQVLKDDEIGKVKTYSNVLDQLQSKIDEYRKAVTTGIAEVDLQPESIIQFQKYISELETDINKLFDTISTKTGKAKSSFGAALGELGTADDTQSATQKIEEYVNSIKQAEVVSKSVKDGVVNVSYTMKGQAGEVNKVTVAWDEMSKTIKMVSVQQVSAAETLSSTLTKLGKKIKDIGIYYTAMNFSPEDLVYKGKEVLDVIVDLDTAMTELKKTTTATAEQIDSFYSHANDIAQDYGNTTAEVINATADWSRMGYSLDESEEMAKLSSQFISISEDMTMDDATGSLISTMKAYGMETDEVLDGIMSKINAVGNAYAVTNADIAEGLRVGSAALSASGTELDSFIAMFTAANEILRDSSSTANGLRTVAMRLRSFNEEGEYDSELANISGDIADLTDGKVRIMKDKDTYLPLEDVMGQIAELVQNNELTDKQQAQLYEKMFGKTRMSVGSSLIANWSTVGKVEETLANSAGSADKEMEAYRESLSFQINALKETWTGLWQDLFPKEGVSIAIKVLTELSKVITTLISNLGLLGAAFTGLSIYKTAKNFDRP